MKLLSGHEVKCPGEAEQEEQKKYFKAQVEGFVRLEPGGWFCMRSFLKYTDLIYKFELRSTDVVVSSYPKSGSTWMQEIVWTMRNNPNLDHPLARQPIVVRVPMIEFDHFLDTLILSRNGDEKLRSLSNLMLGLDDSDTKEGMAFRRCESSPDPRTIKTHLPFCLLPPSLLETAKVVYVMRNPKDVIVSYYHYCRMNKMEEFAGTLDQFIQFVINSKTPFTPYWGNLFQAWSQRSHPNFHLVYYEDLKKGTHEEFKKLSQFLQCGLTDEQIHKLVEFTSFENMKSQGLDIPVEKVATFINVDVAKAEGGFFRKGQAGSNKEEFTPEQHAILDDWIRKNTKQFGKEFKYYME